VAVSATAAPPDPDHVPRRARVFGAAATFWPTWSVPAAYRALRAVLVIPGIFAIASQLMGNEQIALFAVFGGVATLVLVEFSGRPRDKLVAHAALACAGSVLIVIGTVVSSSTALAAVVTFAVTFIVLFSGMVGPNAAIGSTAALLAYVLSAATPGTLSLLPTRLAGWWMASVAGTLAVLLLSPRSPGDRVRAAAAVTAGALAGQIDAALAGSPGSALAEGAMEIKHTLVAAYTGVPHRPTGLSLYGQALARVVMSLEWCCTILYDLGREVAEVAVGAPAIDLQLLGKAATVLRDMSRLLGGADVRPLVHDLEQTALDAKAAAPSGDGLGLQRVHVAFHARMLAAAVRSAAEDALVAGRRDLHAAVAAQTGSPGSRGRMGRRTTEPVLVAARRLVRGNTSVRSVWFLNSVRGAVALAAAVTVADLSDVQHGFWVVLGALSVLRTSAAATGATALRALVGTALGFVVGAGLILAIGTHASSLWAAFPVAVLVAAYTPGTAPFVVGQAAFTVLITVLFNILVPIGWKVGVLRIEDVALGVAVSAVVGVLFWPRGAASVVRDDLADAFHRGGLYLVQATAWALGVRPQAPDAEAAMVQAGVRLDDAVRALLSEQGTKHMPQAQVWRLVGGTERLRLTAQSLAGLSPPDRPDDAASAELVEESAQLAGECDHLAGELGAPKTQPTGATELTAISVDLGPPPAEHSDRGMWVRQHLDHVKENLAELAEPASQIAGRRSWWR